MVKKSMIWKTKGMNRDLSVSAFNSEFSFENINLRLSTKEGNTMMSWVNERGPKELAIKDGNNTSLTITGIPIGTAVIRENLVLFTTETTGDEQASEAAIPVVGESNEGEDVAQEEPTADTEVVEEPKPDRIYKLCYNEGKTCLIGELLYEGNLNFDALHPLETLISYETDLIQKVYWVDGKNQPRLINIVADKSDYTDTSFDFISELSLKEIVKIQKQLGSGGMFAPGVIQYAFTYYQKNGQESNIFYTSPLMYISPGDRGASPDETTVTNSFKISLYNIEKKFDYIRVYSIQRTSLNDIPVVRRVRDIATNSLPVLPENVATYEASYNLEYAPKIVCNGVDYSNIIFSDNSIGNSDAPYIKALKAQQDIERNSDYEFCGCTSDINDPSDPAAGYFYGWMGFRRSIFGDIKIDSAAGTIVFNADEDKVDDKYIRLYDTDNFYNTDAYSSKKVPMLWVSCKVEHISNTYKVSVAKLKSQDDGNEIEAYRVVTTNEILAVENTDQPEVHTNKFSYVISPGDIKSGMMKFNSFAFSMVDNGVIGDTVDPTELLYKGGTTIIPKTLEQKDGTLFFGNYKLQRNSLANIKVGTGQEEKTLEAALKKVTIREDLRNIQVKSAFSSDYAYGNQLTAFDIDDKRSVPCGGFKSGEYYRLGIQFQYKDGSWSEPIHLEDHKVTRKPAFNSSTYITSLPELKYVLTADISGALIDNDYVKARALVVFPKISDRRVLCQGVVNSTVYATNNGFRQSSWFFRARGEGYVEGDTALNPTSSGTLPYTEGDSTTPTLLRKVEIQGNFEGGNKYSVDSRLWTFHTPDAEYDEAFANLEFDGTILHKVGEAGFNKTFSSINIQTESPAISSSAGGFEKKAVVNDSMAGFIGGLFWDDYCVDDNGGTIMAWDRQKKPFKWLVYPWHRNGSLNNDFERPAGMGTKSAILKKKVLANLRIASTQYDNKETTIQFEDGIYPKLFNSKQVEIEKLGNTVYEGNIDLLLTSKADEGFYFAFEGNTQGAYYGISGSGTSFNSHVNCYLGEISTENGHIFKYNNNTWEAFKHIVGTSQPENDVSVGDTYSTLIKDKFLVRMKYKSSPHIIFQIKNNETPDITNGLKICEIIAPNADSTEAARLRFGGNTPDALQANEWIPCGEPVALDSSNSVTVYFSYGDTYFQRWDCLKTYPFTLEDPNQIVEIGSFMLETRINIDGRYDRNRGLLDNTNMSDINFNLFNPVYTQTNNFFVYRILPEDYYKSTAYKNQITWTKTKHLGAETDEWTNITVANTLDLDGDKGSINKLIRLNDQLLAFQDTGIAQIFYNEKNQITTTDGLPIELQDSGKVSGKKYLSDSIGCHNKWSIARTPYGIYFMDSFNKSIYLYNGELDNLSSTKGFDTWCKKTIGDADFNKECTWTPKEFGDFVARYDKQNQEVLFINKDKALAWSEKLQVFTSFYSYGNAPFLTNIDTAGLWITYDNTNRKSRLWQHQEGKYGDFFGSIQPYSMTLIGNPDALTDKVFTNLEFRACVTGEGTVSGQTYTPLLPFDSLEAWNEYQHGMLNLSAMRTLKPSTHFSGGNSALNRKYRIWSCDIPRDNVAIPTDSSDREAFLEKESKMGISRISAHPLDRMRNPWLYLKLEKTVPEDATELPKTEIHDIVMDYMV